MGVWVLSKCNTAARDDGGAPRERGILEEYVVC